VDLVVVVLALLCVVLVVVHLWLSFVLQYFCAFFGWNNTCHDTLVLLSYFFHWFVLRLVERGDCVIRWSVKQLLTIVRLVEEIAYWLVWSGVLFPGT
jgi:hypothetical protein